jgi:hypothetical protein
MIFTESRGIAAHFRVVEVAARVNCRAAQRRPNDLLEIARGRALSTADRASAMW